MMNMKLYYGIVLCGFYLFGTTSAAAYRRLARLEPDHVAAAEDSKDVDDTTPAAGDGLVPSNPMTSMISNVLGAAGNPGRGAVSSVGSGVAGTMESRAGGAVNTEDSVGATTGFMHLNLLANENGTLNMIGKGIINFNSDGTLNISVNSVN